MKLFRPQAYLVTLCLILYLAPSQAVSTLAAGAGETEGVRVEAYRTNLLTPDEERAVGQRLAYLYEQRHKALKDTEAEARLDKVKERLRVALLAQALEITIIQGAQPEAVSFPSGRIFITSALYKLASSDDELAAVIAHEAAHVARHHLSHLIALAQSLPSTKRESFPTRSQIVTGQATQFAFPPALDAARLSCEMEADQLATRWLERAGYRAEALSALLDNLTEHLSIYAQQERAALQSRVTSLARQSFVSLR